jgi:hypothetical protein
LLLDRSSLSRFFFFVQTPYTTIPTTTTIRRVAGTLARPGREHSNTALEEWLPGPKAILSRRPFPPSPPNRTNLTPSSR